MFTSLHPRTSTLNQTHEWRLWSGYLGAGMYEHYHEREYWAIRNSAGLIDVSPLFKYEIMGPDARMAVNRIMTRDITACRVGQVFYSPWCDDDGKMVDDGTISRLDDDRFRITAADPSLRWFQDCAAGMAVAIRDVSDDLAALALQGPRSREILRHLLPGIEDLGYFRLANTRHNGAPLTITRTGYTGDLGYELWIAPDHATTLWDDLMTNGEAYGIMPVGLAALDIARIEAGLILIDVDYIPAPRTFIPGQKSSPFEVGLGWAVKFSEDNPFVGRESLEKESGEPSGWRLAGLEIDWVSLETSYGAVDLPPQVTGRANRSSVPLYTGHRQVGYATSHTFSPLLKKYIGLATLETRFAQPGTPLEMEFTVEHHRRRARAVVVDLPFLDLERKRS
ncbi:MAG TPA: aminomethyltransferase family protein [Anaerolineales bacterium]|nr:aminomethyltransferase family protein [Anaerolineales bacterium]